MKIYAIWWGGGRFFNRLLLLFLSNVAVATFIPGTTCIPDARVSNRLESRYKRYIQMSH